MVSIGTVWDRTVEFVQEHQRQLAPVVLLTLFAPTVFTVTLEKLRATAGTQLGLGLSLLGLLLMLVSLWGQLFLTGYAIERDGSSAASSRATRRFLPVVGISLLLLIGMGALLAPAGVIAIASGLDVQGMAAGRQPSMESMGSFGLIGLYMLVFGLIVLWLAARLLVLTPVVLTERRGLGAIARAFRLTRGLTLKLIGLIILYAIVSTVAVSAARFVFGAILSLVAGGTSTITVADVLTAVAVAAVSAVLSLLSAVFVGKLYVAITGEQDQAAIVE